MSEPIVKARADGPEDVETQPETGRDAACCGGGGERIEPIGPAAGRRAFTVKGLDCAEEVGVLRHAVGPLVGGEDHLGFDVLNGRMIVAEDAARVSDARIQAAVAATGMRANRWRADGEDKGGSDDHRRLQILFTSLSGVALLIGVAVHVWRAGGLVAGLSLFAGHGGQSVPLVEAIAYGAAIVFGARFVVVKAWYAARRLRPDMNLLMVIAVAGAVVIDQWFEAAAVAFLFALSLALESWSVAKARHAISALLDLAPPTVRVLDEGGGERESPAADAAIGTVFVVKPGERIPLDGQVVAGSGAVNQAPITGESAPVLKEPGAEVFAGTIAEDGALEIASTKIATETMLARIIRLVEEAQDRRARSEQWVESFARLYTPAVIVLAIAVFLAPPLFFGGEWADWFYRALVLLVIACPCALVISTPVSIVAALAASARQGVLVKGGAFIELPARLAAIALDKTGTLTRGEASVVAVMPLNDHSERELLERAAALEARSPHPLARAITEHAAARGVAARPAEDVRVLPGKGVVGRFNNELFWLGSHRYLVERGQETAEVAERAAALAHDGQTVIVIGNERHVCGLIAAADTVRPEAAEFITALRAAGIAHVVMLTGDNAATATAIARRVGIDEVRAELLPEDKVAAVAALVTQYGTVAMVGDGVNDAPAMARASFGIAMGAIGTDAAIETADIALMTDDLAKLPWLIRHSRRTLRIIRENISFALGVKAIFVVLTFVGYATLWGAIAADVGASLLVVANALRLLRAKSVAG